MIAGDYYNGRVSKRFDAKLQIDGERVSLIIEDDNELPPVPVSVSELDVTSRLDGVPRNLRFPGGELFRTESNDEIDRLLDAAGLGFEQTVVHKLEQNYRAVALGLILIVTCCGVFLQVGVPWVSDYAMRFVSPDVEATVGKEVMDSLSENNLLLQSETPLERQLEIKEYLASYERVADLRIVRSDFFGANAFAVPGGTVILTDELIKLSRADEELLAVYLHEVGHIRKKHAVRQALRGSLVSLFFVTMTGGMTAATDLTTIVPTTLFTLNYSREFEREADDYALNRLTALDIEPRQLWNFLYRLIGIKENVKESGVEQYLSTHPAPDERLSHITEYQEMYESARREP